MVWVFSPPPNTNKTQGKGYVTALYSTNTSKSSSHECARKYLWHWITAAPSQWSVLLLICFNIPSERTRHDNWKAKWAQSSILPDNSTTVCPQAPAWACKLLSFPSWDINTNRSEHEVTQHLVWPEHLSPCPTLSQWMNEAACIFLFYFLDNTDRTQFSVHFCLSGATTCWAHLVIWFAGRFTWFSFYIKDVNELPDIIKAWPGVCISRLKRPSGLLQLSCSIQTVLCCVSTWDFIFSWYHLIQLHLFHQDSNDVCKPISGLRC